MHDDVMAQAALLHAGGQPGGWGNLGLWPAVDYATASAALADRVAQAAALAPSAQVVSLACGAGEELLRWRRHFGAGAICGVEQDAALLAVAHEQIVDASGDAVGDAVALLRARPARFDAVLIVDAAYHLGARPPLLAAAAAALKPGGRFAFTDLVLDARSSAPARGALRIAARAAGLSAEALAPEARQHAWLAAAGFDEIRIERLDDAVLGGFVRFVQQQRRRLDARARGAAWRRIAGTAALIPLGRALGLGYALIAARRAPPPRVPASSKPAPSRSATTSAERTALSKSGMPGCA